MKNEELNKWLKENVLNDCWHSATGMKAEYGFNICSKCKGIMSSTEDGNWPDYCNSLDMVRRVEDAVREEIVDEVLVNKLQEVVGRASYEQFATARQRAEACKLVWEEHNANR